MPCSCSSSREVLVVRGGPIQALHGELRTKKQSHLPVATAYPELSISHVASVEDWVWQILAQTANFTGCPRALMVVISKKKSFSSSIAGAGGLLSEPHPGFQ